jgi:hypothetical protein
MQLSHLIAAFILVAFFSLFMGILTAAGILPVFLFDLTPRGFLSFTYTSLMFAITLMLWELRSRLK